jgi:hypothetical protein
VPLRAHDRQQPIRVNRRPRAETVLARAKASMILLYHSGGSAEIQLRACAHTAEWNSAAWIFSDQDACERNSNSEMPALLASDALWGVAKQIPS